MENPCRSESRTERAQQQEEVERGQEGEEVESFFSSAAGVHVVGQLQTCEDKVLQQEASVSKSSRQKFNRSRDSLSGSSVRAKQRLSP